MIDISDGLLRDAERLGRASDVVLAFEAAALPPDADLLSVAELLGEADPAGWVLTGGEDHALLACFPAEAALPPSFRRVGVVQSRSLDPDDSSGLDQPAYVLVDGEPIAGPGGWRHYA